MTAAQTFAYSGALVAVTVPADASVATIECWGAQPSAPTTDPVAGGMGGYAKGSLGVTPGQILYVAVGGADGWNGGGSSSYSGGGGASDVRVGGSVLANRVIVAGGGGGSGKAANGGVWVYSAGSAGGGLAGAFTGGTQTAGGSDYAGGGNTPGQLGVGGVGGFVAASTDSYGGGGGGGYYGGGGGYAYQDSSGYDGVGNPGGGGSSYIAGLVNALTNSGIQSGDGQVTITWSNTAPLAPTPLSPGNNSSVLTPPTLTWAFADPDPGDIQTKADIQYRLSGAPSWTSLPAAATTAGVYTFGGGVIAVGSSYEWQVRTYDKTGTVGPWSGSFFFTAVAQPPAATITTPASGASLLNTPTTVAWTLPGGYTETQFQVQRCSDAAGTIVYYDSGQITSSVLSSLVPLDRVSGRTDWFRVRYYAGIWSTWATVSAVTYVGPPQPPLVVAVADPVTASVTVRITNPPQTSGYATAVSNDLTRTGPDGVTVRLATGLPVGAVFTDWLPGAGINTYQATAYASNGATSTSI